ncbi:MAG: hypothetical protein KME35_23770 [Aphanocapsa sp. GSE-SYN-MK-11-07L]|jgi:hypothetical protein|nr:hypothetical protein [Aphanocapsa sp. GSE-SYN-MK-11-07L]
MKATTLYEDSDFWTDLPLVIDQDHLSWYAFCPLLPIPCIRLPSYEEVSNLLQSAISACLQSLTDQQKTDIEKQGKKIVWLLYLYRHGNNGNGKVLGTFSHPKLAMQAPPLLAENLSDNYWELRHKYWVLATRLGDFVIEHSVLDSQVQ